jgi:hypothetical protein
MGRHAVRKMSEQHHQGMRPGDLAGKPYGRFWQPTMGPLPSEVADALRAGEKATHLGLELRDARKLLEPGYLLLENGFTVLDTGQTYVAVRTDMPGCTGAMFEWWMGWHTMEDERYKLWHPRDHVANGTREMRGDDPSLSDREKYTTTHYVTEYVGGRRYDVRITFIDPSGLFGEELDLAAGGTTALVVGRVALQRVPIQLGWLVHQIRVCDGRTEMRSRLWLGVPELLGSREGDVRNKLLGSAMVRGLLVPRNLGRDMIVHCAQEMNHLAGFLPQLFALYHPEPARTPSEKDSCIHQSD